MKKWTALALVFLVGTLTHSFAHAAPCAIYDMEFGQDTAINKAFVELSAPGDAPLSKDAEELKQALQESLDKDQCVVVVFEEPNRGALAAQILRPSKGAIDGRVQAYYSNYPISKLPKACFSVGPQDGINRLKKCYNVAANGRAMGPDDHYQMITYYTGGGSGIREALQNGEPAGVITHNLLTIQPYLEKQKRDKEARMVSETLMIYGVPESFFWSQTAFYYGYKPDLTSPDMWTTGGTASTDTRKLVDAGLFLAARNLVFVDHNMGGPKIMPRKDYKAPQSVSPVGGEPISELEKTMNNAGYEFVGYWREKK